MIMLRNVSTGNRGLNTAAEPGVLETDVGYTVPKLVTCVSSLVLNVILTVKSRDVFACECCHRRAGVSGSATRMNLPRSVSTSIRHLFAAAEHGVLVE